MKRWIIRGVFVMATISVATFSLQGCGEETSDMAAEEQFNDSTPATGACHTPILPPDGDLSGGVTISCTETPEAECTRGTWHAGDTCPAKEVVK